MIQILGNPFQKNYIWKSDSIESVIIKRIQEAKVIYSYQSLDELLFELNLRKNIINSVIEMSKGRAKFNIFSNSHANRECWRISIEGNPIFRNFFCILFLHYFHL